MAKQLLIETRMNSLSLCEGVQTKHPGCLGTLSGPCADFKNPTRNNNFYSRKLWENVFKDPLVKESLEDRVLIGELDHPGDRLETKATNAAIVMTGYDFDDQNGTVNGTFDILDTPNGRILRSLLDYGCKIGVSSRGEGDVTTEESNGKTVENVDEDTYYFVGFDAVVLPAVKKAKPALQESLKRESLKESLSKQIKEAKTRSELDLIGDVVKATELPELDSLLESIKIKSEELEGVNDSSNLMEDLEQATQQIQKLTKDNKILKQEVADSKSRIQKLIESKIKSKSVVAEMSKKLESLEVRCKSLLRVKRSSDDKIGVLESKLRESERTVDELKESLSQSELVKSKSDRQIASLEESLSDSQALCRSKSEEIAVLSKKVEVAVKQLSESKARESKLRQTLKSTKSTAQSTLTAYASRRSESLGLNTKRVLESITPGMTTSDVDEILRVEIDRQDRYSKLPSTNDSLLEALSSGHLEISSMKPDEETAQTMSFMKTFYHVD